MAAHDACTLLDDDHNAVSRRFEQHKAAHEADRKQLAQQFEARRAELMRGHPA
jgi:hypothetical protein